MMGQIIMQFTAQPCRTKWEGVELGGIGGGGSGTHAMLRRNPVTIDPHIPTMAGRVRAIVRLITPFDAAEAGGGYLPSSFSHE